MNTNIPDSLFLGQLEREYLINAQGQIFIDQPGGNLLHAAAGFHLWGQSAGLISRVGSDYPLEWLDGFEREGFDIAGIKQLDQTIDLRSFYWVTNGFPRGPTVVKLESPFLCGKATYLKTTKMFEQHISAPWISSATV